MIVHRVAKSHKEFVFVSRFTLFIRIPFILGKAHPNLIRFLGCEDLEKGQSTHSSILVLPLWLSW